LFLCLNFSLLCLPLFSISPLVEVCPTRARFWFIGSGSLVLLRSLPVSSERLIWPSKLEMDRHFSVEAKAFSFLAKAGKSELHLEGRRKGFVGFIFMGYQCSIWLAATVEVLLSPGKDFVKSFHEDVKILMVRRGDNKAGHFLEVTIFAKGGRKGCIWLPKGHAGGVLRMS
jgi:hypothetical protein